jgi:ParB-like chromosome segregation protein Spo0J
VTVLAQTYELADIDDLKPHPDNPRVGEVGTIAASIDAHGFYGAVVVQKSTGFVLAGNHRLSAARAKGLTQVPAIYIDADETLAKRILLVDNRASERATWDHEALAELLGDLDADGVDLASIGYDPADLDALNEYLANLGLSDDAEGSALADDAIDLDDTETVNVIVEKGHRPDLYALLADVDWVVNARDAMA